MIKRLEDIDRVEWQKLVDTSAVASFFQSPECYDFFCSLSFLDTFGWAIYTDGVLKGVVLGYVIANGGKLKQFFSKRAIIPGGVLLADDIETEEVEMLLWQTIQSLSKKVIYIEIRNNSDYSRYKSIFERNNFEYQPHLNYLVNTSDGFSVIDKYSKSKRRQLKKAYMQDVVCEPTTDMREIDRFYEILNRLYRNKARKPLFPKEFFEKLVRLPNGCLFVVKKDAIVIGGIACAVLPGKAVYEWFVCGDIKNYNHLYPSVVATHKGIEYAEANTLPCFDFMGAGKPHRNYGVREFKSKFGGKLVEYGRFIHVVNKPLFRLGQKVVATKLMSFFGNNKK